MSSFMLFGCLEIILIVLVVSWLVKWIVSRVPVKNPPPGPPGLPLIGNALSLLSGDRLALWGAWTKEYGEIFQFRMGSRRLILINSTEAMLEAFQNAHLHGRTPDNFRYMILGHYNNGVVTSVGETWRQQRQFVHKVFRRLGVGKRSYEDTITFEVAKLSEAFDEFHERPFDPSDLVSCAVSNVICTSVFGTQYNYSDPEFRLILHNITRLFELSGTGSLIKMLPWVYLLPFGPPRALADTYRALFDFIDNAIESHKRTLVDDHPRDFIDLYLQKIGDEMTNGSSFDKDNLKGTIFDVFIAGTETTSSTLKWMLMYMMAFPDVQSRVQAELDHVVGRDRIPSLADRESLPYTNAVMLECQRHGRPVPLTLPHMATEDTVLRGFTIPKGAALYGNMGYINSDEREWNAPHEFRPDRFLTADGTPHLKKQNKMITFSTGMRACPGEQLARQELFLFFTGLLHRFSFKKPVDSNPLSFAGVMGMTRNTEPFTTSAVKRNT